MARTNTKTYEIFNTESGDSLGYYCAENKGNALVVCMADVGHDGPINPALYACEVDMVAAFQAMDCELMEELQCDEWRDKADFFTAYCFAHIEKFGEEFIF